jgi:hypothetical protein
LSGLNRHPYSLILVLGVLSLLGCDDERPPEEEILVEAYGQFFLKDDLRAQMPQTYNREDSAKIADEIINNWINQKVILEFAERNIDSDNEEFEQKIANYRNSLVIYEYERALINQKLDTNISSGALEEYYEANQANFKLNSVIVKVWFVQISADAPKQNKVEKWFLDGDTDDFDKLYEYCQKYAENFFFEENNWLYLDELLKEIPIKEDDWELFLKNNTSKIFEVGEYKYLVRFFDYGLKGSVSPMALEKEKIRDLILNKRKVDLIKSMRENMVKEAFKSGNVKVSEL